MRENVQQVTQLTGSRTFGDNCDDYMMLCKRLGLNLTRLKAQELNIASRGGSKCIENHVIRNNSQNCFDRKVTMSEALLKSSKLEDELEKLPDKRSKAKPLPTVNLKFLTNWLNRNYSLLKNPNILFMPKINDDLRWSK